MPQESISIFIQKLKDTGILQYAWILVISVWAGVAKGLSNLNGKKPTLMGILTDATISGFVGVIAASTCQYMKLDFMLTSAITGICAHNGTRSLYLITEFLKKKRELDPI